MLYCARFYPQNLIMKFTLSKYLTFTICFSLVTFCTAQEAFITTWKTNNSGSSNNKSITIPTQGNGYNYDIDWNNDGIYEQTGVTNSVTHNFGTAGTYTIRIKGNFPRIRFAGGGDAKKILTVNQWGTGKWKSMKKAFEGCVNLTIQATDAPDLSEATSMHSMFADAHNINQDINHWNTANITNMAFLFKNAKQFNKPLNNWNTAKVTNMKGLFRKAIAFNQNINNWNTSLVNNMQALFFKATQFNQPLNNWDTRKVTTMKSMFQGASSFNQPLINWTTTKVENMASMFLNAQVFNRNINNWNTTNVTTMAKMFQKATVFNQNLNLWNTQKVTNMNSMFLQAKDFNQNLSSWNVEQVNNFTNMLKGVTLSHANYDALLISWNNQNLNNNISFHAGHSKYCSIAAKNARLQMIQSNNWTINDKGQCQTLNTLNENTASPIQLTPNPVRNVLYVKANVNLKIVKIECFDIIGKRISVFNGTERTLDLSHLKNGLYFLRIHSNNIMITKKFIKR